MRAGIDAGRDRLHPHEERPERGGEAGDRDHQVRARDGEQVREPARAERLVVHRIEVALPQHQRPPERRRVRVEGGLDARPHPRPRPIDERSQGPRSAQHPHVDGPAARGHTGARDRGSGIGQLPMREEVQRSQVGHEREAITAAEILGRAVEPRPEGRRQGEPAARAARDLHVDPRLLGAARGASTPDDHRRAHHLALPLAARRRGQCLHGAMVRRIAPMELRPRAQTARDERDGSDGEHDATHAPAKDEPDAHCRDDGGDGREREGRAREQGERDEDDGIDHDAPLQQGGRHRGPTHFAAAHSVREGLRQLAPPWRQLAPPPRQHLAATGDLLLAVYLCAPVKTWVRGENAGARCA